MANGGETAKAVGKPSPAHPPPDAPARKNPRTRCCARRWVPRCPSPPASRPPPAFSLLSLPKLPKPPAGAPESRSALVLAVQYASASVSPLTCASPSYTLTYHAAPRFHRRHNNRCKPVLQTPQENHRPAMLQ